MNGAFISYHNSVCFNNLNASHLYIHNQNLDVTMSADNIAYNIANPQTGTVNNEIFFPLFGLMT